VEKVTIPILFSEGRSPRQIKRRKEILSKINEEHRELCKRTSRQNLRKGIRISNKGFRLTKEKERLNHDRGEIRTHRGSTGLDAPRNLRSIIGKRRGDSVGSHMS